ncbi:MAG TPA: hypothetical protein VNH11_23455 [Pirellulales bacterium]|nr:hypothetical protein [Pirellulales bacterium]
MSYADTNASDFVTEIDTIDLADKTAADGAANASEQLSTTLTDDEAAFEQSLDPASRGFEDGVGQAQHDYRQAMALADYNLAIGGTAADYATAVADAQTTRQGDYDTPYANFAGLVMPAITQQGTDDAGAELLDTQTTDGEGLTDIQDNNHSVDGYQDEESALYAGQQDTQAQALDAYLLPARSSGGLIFTVEKRPTGTAAEAILRILGKWGCNLPCFGQNSEIRAVASSWRSAQGVVARFAQTLVCRRTHPSIWAMVVGQGTPAGRSDY